MSSPPGGEVELIARLSQLLGEPPSEVILGIGDDCAVLDLGGPDYWLWTMDTLIEEVHFHTDYMPPYQLGRKSLAVNLSDIAAMGGEPLYALVSLGWPPGRDLAGALEFGEGLAASAREYQMAVIGGDTVASPEGISVTLTVLGRVPKNEMLGRFGAKAGDRLYVTGPLGLSAAGLEVLKGNLSLDEKEKAPLVQAHLDPRPQLAAGRLLAKEKLATAMIDLSDGVATDLMHLCRQSGLGARLWAEAVPLTSGVLKVAALLNRDPLDLALTGGEDYELLFTVPPVLEDRLPRAFAQAGLRPPHLLGEMVPGEEVLLITGKKEKIISGRGYDHFRLDPREESV
jgi:thiamine-monophosphate kinase